MLNSEIRNTCFFPLVGGSETLTFFDRALVVVMVSNGKVIGVINGS